ncbi:hypothetical protein LTR81_000927 [Elasticomyces elasticus]
MTEPTPTLLGIPPELRTRIYEFALIDDSERIWLQPSRRSCAGPPLLRVNRQLRSETTAIYYGANQFEGGSLGMHEFIPFLTPERLDLLQRVRFWPKEWSFIGDVTEEQLRSTIGSIKRRVLVLKGNSERKWELKALLTALVEFPLKHMEAGTVWGTVGELSLFRVVIGEDGKRRWVKTEEDVDRRRPRKTTQTTAVDFTMADVTLDPPLLRIPPELRNIIYELVFIKDDPISVKNWALCCVGPALLQTSRLIRSETSPLFYGGNKFEGSWVTEFPSMPLYVTPASLRLMKHFRFNGDAYMRERVRSEAKKKEVLRFYRQKLRQVMVKVGYCVRGVVCGRRAANDSGEYAGHALDILGETSRANTLVYLDSGRIFVGSHQGDSQVIEIREGGFDVVQTFPNIAPILDFTVMDMGNRSADAVVNEFSSGQARIVTGSGAYKDGSLRSVRSGVGLDDVGSIGGMGAPVTGVFSLKSSASSRYVDTLIVSFVSSTRVFRFEADGDVEEVEALGGFAMGEATLYAGNLSNGKLVQVTSSAVLLTEADEGMVSDSWQPPNGSSITAVAAEGDKVLVSLGGAALVVLDLAKSGIKVQAQKEFAGSEQVSCIALSKSVPNSCVAGFWQDSKVALLSLSDLQPISTTSVADEGEGLAVPRSLIIANILPEAAPTLFVGLADGNVVTYVVESAERPFTARKSIILGTQRPNFALLPRGDGELENVFATCEHPSLIFGSEGRMVYSAVTAESAQGICSFDCEAYPGAIAIASADGELKLTIVDEERTTHVQTLPVHETVRRIAYSAELKAFGLGTIKRTMENGVEDVSSCFRLVDEVAFQELHSFRLKNDELVESCMRCQLDDGSGSGDTAERFVVGTAFLDDEATVEDGQTLARGRLLVFEVTEERRLKLITELSLRGACRCLGMCNGRIVAALIKTVVVYAFEYQTSSTPFLVKKAAYRTATAPIDLAITGSTIAVTDLMKSVSLLQYTPGRVGASDSLSEIARHFETLWGTAVANVAENTYLASDAEGNLVVLQHDINGYSAEDQRRLRPVSELLLGEMVNRIRPITVKPTPNALVIPRAFVATVEGGVYLFCLIAPGHQDTLMRLQTLLADRVVSPGNVPFAKWRGFRSQVRDAGEEGPTRFVDGELVERFLDAPHEVQDEVAKELGRSTEEVRGWVEGLRRIH